jgi:hypothetical protein
MCGVRAMSICVVCGVSDPKNRKKGGPLARNPVGVPRLAPDSESVDCGTMSCRMKGDARNVTYSM